jgi:hypothetical protein
VAVMSLSHASLPHCLITQHTQVMVARVLWLLCFDSGKGSLLKAFRLFADFVAPWIWLLWIPQMLTSLARPEVSVL